ncbi:hypothetical protein K1719_010935 [Acacia pycnantha]|nr:hypothetical protein K1719_010935 [Acacia pycnantha]
MLRIKENLSLIREQLSQIENNQSNLLNLLQQFIGSSQSGMNYLETRVQGLEMALDEISHDLAVSCGRLSNTDAAEDMCCHGSEFLSSKFWKKIEGQCSGPREFIQISTMLIAKKGHNQFTLLSYVCLVIFRGFDLEDFGLNYSELLSDGHDSD